MCWRREGYAVLTSRHALSVLPWVWIWENGGISIKEFLKWDFWLKGEVCVFVFFLKHANTYFYILYIYTYKSLCNFIFATMFTSNCHLLVTLSSCKLCDASTEDQIFVTESCKISVTVLSFLDNNKEGEKYFCRIKLVWEALTARITH